MIPRSKFGNCSNCDATNTECVKVGKSLYCLKCRNYDKAKQQTERANKRLLDRVKDKDNERSYIIQDLDAFFSKYIRIKEANENGINTCYTCGKKDHWKNLQCSHYVKRGHYGLRWDSRNAKPACIKCNEFLEGNMGEYTKKLELETPGLPEQLLEEAKEPHKWTRDDLKEMLIDIRAKLKLVKTKINA